MSRLLRLAVAVLGLLILQNALAAPRAVGCVTGRLPVAPDLALLEDPGGRLDRDQVAALPDSRFQPSDGRLERDLSRSAYWLRFRLENLGDDRCPLWLTIGQPRLEDIRVYIRRGEAWSEQRAGSAHPLETWPVVERQPLFPVALAAGERADVWVRVASRGMLTLEPSVWSPLGLLRERQWTQTVDGISLGIVLLVVPFSLIVGGMVRSRLLLVHAGAVATYIAMSCVLNGYLVFWPAALPWSQEITLLLSLVSFLFFFAYLCVLYRVHRLPRVWHWLYGAAPLLYGAFSLWGVWGDPAQSRQWIFLLLGACVYVLVPLTLWAGWRRGLRHGWMAWTVAGLFLLQFLLRHVLHLDEAPFQSRHERYSLLSTLPGVLLLVGTLVMEFSRSRARERRALDDLGRQRQAEQERLENTVALRTEQLRESLRARSALMARISHDLRSPLVSIIDYARLLRGAPDPDYPRRIERNARQQLELIDELLEFSRSELDQLELILAPGYLYGFLREIEDEAAFLASRHGNRFESRLAPDLPALVRADFRRLRQVLVNLLANAAKFTQNGCITFEVSAGSAADGREVELRFAVLDTGIGIEPADRESLMQPFRRGRNVGERDGSGLGLSIVSQLLGYMGSRLEIESRPEGGSRFGFRVTLERAEEDDLDFALVDDPSVRLNGEGRRILLVDDVMQNLDGLSDLLTGYGFEVERAGDGREALDRLEAGHVDLVITDQAMPRMDGWTLLAQLRERWPGLPVMLYSAAPPQPTTERGPTFDAVLLKPASSRDLLACVGRALRMVAASAPEAH